MVDLKCHLDAYSCSFFLFDFLSKGKIDKISGQYFLGNKDTSNILEDQSDQSMKIEDVEERCYMYAPYLFH